MFTLENGTGRVSHYWVSTLSSERSHVKAVCRGGCCLQKDFDEQDVPPGTLESPQRRCVHQQEEIKPGAGSQRHSRRGFIINRRHPRGRVVKNPPADAGDLGDLGLILGLGREDHLE